MRPSISLLTTAPAVLVKTFGAVKTQGTALIFGRCFYFALTHGIIQGQIISFAIKRTVEMMKRFFPYLPAARRPRAIGCMMALAVLGAALWASPAYLPLAALAAVSVIVLEVYRG